MSARIVLTTVAATDDARPLARRLVDERLAACVNIIPRLASVYRWEGAVTEDEEQLLVIKTSAERVDDLREVLLAAHPYAVPEFVVLAVESMSEAYGRWLLGEVGLASSAGNPPPDVEREHS